MANKGFYTAPFLARKRNNQQGDNKGVAHIKYVDPRTGAVTTKIVEGLLPDNEYQFHISDEGIKPYLVDKGTMSSILENGIKAVADRNSANFGFNDPRGINFFDAEMADKYITERPTMRSAVVSADGKAEVPYADRYDAYGNWIGTKTFPAEGLNPNSTVTAAIGNIGGTGSKQDYIFDYLYNGENPAVKEVNTTAAVEGPNASEMRKFYYFLDRGLGRLPKYAETTHPSDITGVGNYIGRQADSGIVVPKGSGSAHDLSGMFGGLTKENQQGEPYNVGQPKGKSSYKKYVTEDYPYDNPPETQGQQPLESLVERKVDITSLPILSEREIDKKVAEHPELYPNRYARISEEKIGQMASNIENDYRQSFGNISDEEYGKRFSWLLKFAKSPLKEGETNNDRIAAIKPRVGKITKDLPLDEKALRELRDKLSEDVIRYGSAASKAASTIQEVKINNQTEYDNADMTIEGWDKQQLQKQKDVDAKIRQEREERAQRTAERIKKGEVKIADLADNYLAIKRGLDNEQRKKYKAMLVNKGLKSFEENTDTARLLDEFEKNRAFFNKLKPESIAEMMKGIDMLGYHAYDKLDTKSTDYEGKQVKGIADVNNEETDMNAVKKSSSDIEREKRAEELKKKVKLVFDQELPFYAPNGYGEAAADYDGAKRTKPRLIYSDTGEEVNPQDRAILERDKEYLDLVARYNEQYDKSLFGKTTTGLIRNAEGDTAERTFDPYIYDEEGNRMISDKGEDAFHPNSKGKPRFFKYATPDKEDKYEASYQDNVHNVTTDAEELTKRRFLDEMKELRKKYKESFGEVINRETRKRASDDVVAKFKQFHELERQIAEDQKKKNEEAKVQAEQQKQQQRQEYDENVKNIVQNSQAPKNVADSKKEFTDEEWAEIQYANDENRKGYEAAHTKHVLDTRAKSKSKDKQNPYGESKEAISQKQAEANSRAEDYSIPEKDVEFVNKKYPIEPVVGRTLQEAEGYYDHSTGKYYNKQHQEVTEPEKIARFEKWRKSKEAAFSNRYSDEKATKVADSQVRDAVNTPIFDPEGKKSFYYEDKPKKKKSETSNKEEPSLFDKKEQKQAEEAKMFKEGTGIEDAWYKSEDARENKRGSEGAKGSQEVPERLINPLYDVHNKGEQNITSAEDADKVTKEVLGEDETVGNVSKEKHESQLSEAQIKFLHDKGVKTITPEIEQKFLKRIEEARQRQAEARKQELPVEQKQKLANEYTLIERGNEYWFIDKAGKYPTSTDASKLSKILHENPEMFEDRKINTSDKGVLSKKPEQAKEGRTFQPQKTGAKRMASGKVRDASLAVMLALEGLANTGKIARYIKNNASESFNKDAILKRRIEQNPELREALEQLPQGLEDAYASKRVSEDDKSKGMLDELLKFFF